MQRHGPMVLGVCRRVLRHAHDAEDAFQATFLVLARKAASVVKASRWLLAAPRGPPRRGGSGRGQRPPPRAMERRITPCPIPPSSPRSRRTGGRFCDQELGRLPRKYRTAVILCELEGKTPRKRRRRFRRPEGALSGRLTTARRMLADRLSRRGLDARRRTWQPRCPGRGVGSRPFHPDGVNRKGRGAGRGWFPGGDPGRRRCSGDRSAQDHVSGKAEDRGERDGAGRGGVAVGGTAYRGGPTAAGVQAAEPKKHEVVKPANELEALRKKVELLEINLQIVLEKVRAQEIEIRELKEKQAAKGAARDSAPGPPTNRLAPDEEMNPFRSRPSPRGAARPKPDKPGRQAADNNPPPEGIEGQVRKARRQAGNDQHRQRRRLEGRAHAGGLSPRAGPTPVSRPDQDSHGDGDPGRGAGRRPDDGGDAGGGSCGRPRGGRGI